MREEGEEGSGLLRPASLEVEVGRGSSLALEGELEVEVEGEGEEGVTKNSREGTVDRRREEEGTEDRRRDNKGGTAAVAEERTVDLRRVREGIKGVGTRVEGVVEGEGEEGCAEEDRCRVSRTRSIRLEEGRVRVRVRVKEGREGSGEEVGGGGGGGDRIRKSESLVVSKAGLARERERRFANDIIA